jgi:hypothetical protein
MRDSCARRLSPRPVGAESLSKRSSALATLSLVSPLLPDEAECPRCSDEAGCPLSASLLRLKLGVPFAACYPEPGVVVPDEAWCPLCSPNKLGVPFSPFLPWHDNAITIAYNATYDNQPRALSAVNLQATANTLIFLTDSGLRFARRNLQSLAEHHVERPRRTWSNT